jgi:hypothetical protein
VAPVVKFCGRQNGGVSHSVFRLKKVQMKY